jgi:hypothetical protein
MNIHLMVLHLMVKQLNDNIKYLNIIIIIIIIMKYIILILSSIIFSTFSLKNIKPKLCINCKHFISNFYDDKYGKCALFPKIETDISYLVNGINEIKNDEFYYCTTVRSSENKCGKEGKLFKKNKL